MTSHHGSSQVSDASPVRPGAPEAAEQLQQVQKPAADRSPAEQHSPAARPAAATGAAVVSLGDSELSLQAPQGAESAALQMPLSQVAPFWLLPPLCSFPCS